MKLSKKIFAFGFSLITFSSSALAERTYNWPTISGRKIAADMDTFRTLNSEETRDFIADRFCERKGHDYHTNWGTVFRDWSQREALWQIKETYRHQLEWRWQGHEGGYLFSSISCG